MKVYYITEKEDKTDIFFFDPVVKFNKKKLTCLAFFYTKSSAQEYKEYLKKNGEEETNMIIRSQKIGGKKKP